MPADPLSTIFAALADPTRRAILASLAGGERTVTELRAPFAISQPAVSRHLRVLEDAGSVAAIRQVGRYILVLAFGEPLRRIVSP